MNSHKLLGIFSLIMITILYQNCGQFNTDVPDDGIIMASACDTGTQELFQSTFYSFTKSSCVNCHTEAGPGQGAFASSNVVQAYTDFKLMGADRIASYATNAGHASPYTGSSNNATVIPLLAQWKTATSNCGLTQSAAVILKDKTFGITTAGPFGSSQAKTIAWDLGSELQKGSSLSGLTFQLSVYAESHVISPQETSYNYVFTNLKLNTADSNVHVQGIHIYVNGELASTVTGYNELDVVIPAKNTTYYVSKTGQPFVMNLSAQDSISVHFDVLVESTLVPSTNLLK